MKIYNLKDRTEYLDEVANLEYEEWAKETGNKKWIHVYIPASKISSRSTFKYLSEYYAVE